LYRRTDWFLENNGRKICSKTCIHAYKNLW